MVNQAPKAKTRDDIDKQLDAAGGDDQSKKTSTWQLTKVFLSRNTKMMESHQLFLQV